MKSVVVLLEKMFVCPVAVEVPDWWDDATAKQRIGTPIALHDLDCMADPDAWEESQDLPAIFSICDPAGYVKPVMSFGQDDPMPGHPLKFDFPP